ncbi:MAG TPA: HAD-IA family hydrolase [Polyangiaceae bacterium]|nr:HAD-IA family hydrolase [Polyangiaceae bacterium]
MTGRLAGAQRLRGVVFDLDGTLIDSGGDIAAAALHALRTHGFPELPLPQLLSYVGDGARPLLSRSAGIEPSDPRLDALYESFISYYQAHPVVHTRFCSGARAALSELSGLALALCTNKPRVTTELVLSALGIAELFRVVVAGGDLPRSKPDPLPVLHIAKALGLPAEALAMVGDGAQDVLAGRNAGALSVGVRGGIQPIERLLAARPDILLDSLAELPGALSAYY